jgi:O-antigen ligase
MYELSSHSTVIELLSTTGVIGFVAYYGALVYMFVKTLNFIKAKAKSLFTVCFLTILVLSYFNPIQYFYEMQITLFFVLPILFRKKAEENEELAN